MFINASFNISHGLGQSAKDVIRALVANDYHVIVLSRDSFSVIDEKITWISLSSLKGFPRRLDRKFPFSIASWFRNLTRRSISNRMLNEKSVDLIIVNSLANHEEWNSLKNRVNLIKKKTSCLIVRESPGHFCADNNRRSVKWAVTALNSYDFHIYVSTNVFEQWKEFGIVPKCGVFNVPNCCNEITVRETMTVDRPEIRKQLNLPDDRFLLVCLGSVQKRKGQDILVDNFISLQEACPDLLLLLVGPTVGTWGDVLVKKIKKNKRLSKGIKIYGVQKDALRWIYASDALVLPSRAEALPRVILEAMALGTPVAASNVDGVPELIENGILGRLFESENAAEMIAAVADLRNDRVLASKLAENAHTRYWQEFSHEKQIKRYGEALRNMIEDK